MGETPDSKVHQPIRRQVGCGHKNYDGYLQTMVVILMMFMQTKEYHIFYENVEFIECNLHIITLFQDIVTEFNFTINLIPNMN